MIGIKGLLESRRFWTLILDMVITLVLYFVGKYAGETVLSDMKIVIASIQPVFLAVIIAFTADNTAQIRANAHIDATAIQNGYGFEEEVDEKK